MINIWKISNKKQESFLIIFKAFNSGNYNYQWYVNTYCFSCRHIISLLILVTFIQEKQSPKSISYIKTGSKKKPSVDRLLAHINNSTANNWDKKSVEDTARVLRAKA